MLSYEWAGTYTEYLENNKKFPEEIDNKKILLINEDNKLMIKKLHVDFELVCEDTWILIHNLYGGGPKVTVD